MMTSGASALRQLFIDFFIKHGHRHVPSAPLVPHGDASLLFTNAGMVPFKDTFLGIEKPPYKKAVSCQKCMRVSGKHNDLEEVGRTKRHHTFFEMLGNFSFGDYFKEEAIYLAWQFIDQELQCSRDKLYITVFGGTKSLPADNEARTLWKKISGLSDGQILNKGMEDNFWAMGDQGPCGPCTEVHIDLGEGEADDAAFASGRIVEIWNNVFMQYIRKADGSLISLPAPAVDTGMGLERVAALCAGTDSNYHTDLFLPIIEEIAALANRPYKQSASEEDVSMRVVADHARAIAFLIADGVQPSNEGRGYVLRRIARRAVRHARRLKISDAVLPTVTQKVVALMHNVYPELSESASLIEKVAVNEEESFARTLDAGLQILGEALSLSLGHVRQGKAPVLSGEVAFKLYDTYGFPKDLTESIAQERGIDVDIDGFDQLMQAQQHRSRGAHNQADGQDTKVYHTLLQTFGPTTFAGWPHESTPLNERSGTWQNTEGWLESLCHVRALIVDGQSVATAHGEQQVQVIIEPCLFYGESGGQAGDVGRLRGIAAEDDLQVDIVDTQKPIPEITVAHAAIKRGQLKVNQSVWAGYEVDRRLGMRAHHSATHALHHALRKNLGEHVKQAGSLVTPARLRFDFSHFSALSSEQISAIEQDVAQQIKDKRPVLIEELALDAARKKGAMALFGEKYGERVRVISMGESIELCGGTHAKNTGDLGLLLITREQAVKSGIRRVEAEVGQAVAHTLATLWRQLRQVAVAIGADSVAWQVPRWVKSDAGWEGAIEPSHDRLLKHVAATLARLSAINDALEQAGQKPLATGAMALGLESPPCMDTLDIVQAQSLRDTYQALSRIAQGKLSDGPQLLMALSDKDVGCVAHGLFNLMTTLREGEAHLSRTQDKDLAMVAKEFAQAAEEIAGSTRLVTRRLTQKQSAHMRALADLVRQAMGSGVVCFVGVDGEKVSLLIALTKDMQKRLKAGQLVSELAHLIGGRGGGRTDMAQAGGRNPGGIDALFAALRDHLAQIRA